MYSKLTENGGQNLGNSLYLGEVYHIKLSEVTVMESLNVYSFELT